MRTIFWNVDTQYDFMRPDGKLYVKDAETIENNLAKLTMLAEKKGIVVVNTADRHYKDSKELSDKPDFMATFPEHCMADTPGAEYVFATAPKDPYIIDWKSDGFSRTRVKNAKNIILYKDAFDIFAGNKFANDVVKIIEPKVVVAYGVATNVCVDFAVMGLLERGKEVYVPLDAIKGLPQLPLDETLNKWKDNGAKLTTVDEIVNMYKTR